jgi:DNA-3-methyladenine glycosylase II
MNNSSPWAVGLPEDTITVDVTDGVLVLDHPGWHLVPAGADGVRRRVAQAGTGLWEAVWQPGGLTLRVLHGQPETPPVITRTTSADLPPRIPAALRRELVGLGVVHRLSNPCLWDAITTAVLRQVVRAAQARALYARWCRAHGRPVTTEAGKLALVPDPETVLGLDERAFAQVGAAFHRTALRAVAEVYLAHGAAWSRLGAAALVDVLCRVPRIGPWTARAAAADFTGDFTGYPHGDLAVRTWAARAAAPDTFPSAAAAFEATWTGLAETGQHLHALTALTLAWGSHARPPALEPASAQASPARRRRGPDPRPGPAVGEQCRRVALPDRVRSSEKLHGSAAKNSTFGVDA